MKAMPPTAAASHNAASGCCTWMTRHKVYGVRLFICRGFWSDVLLAAHVRAQGCRDAHAAVELLVNLEQGQQDTRRGNGGVVQCMHKLHLAVLIAIADVDAAGLPLVEVRTRVGFAVAALAGYPAFQVVHAHFAVTHVTRADVDHAVRQFQRLHQFFRVRQQLFVPAHRFRMVGLADDILLYFVELVDAEDAACVLAIGASFFAEARAKANEGQRQVFSFEYLVFVHAGDRDLGCAYQEKVLFFQGVDLVAPLWKLPAADEAEIARHGWHYQGRESPARYTLHGEVHQRQFETGSIAF